jgi:hypothetical protein
MRACDRTLQGDMTQVRAWTLPIYLKPTEYTHTSERTYKVLITQAQRPILNTRVSESRQNNNYTNARKSNICHRTSHLGERA